MIELTGQIQNLAIDFKTGKAVLSLIINEKNDVSNLVDSLSDSKLVVKIGKYRKKRSLDSNSYAWLLITEIGNVLLANKEDIYLQMLKRYGQSEMISVLDEVPIRNYFKYIEEVGEGKVNGKDFKHYKVYKGSSDFDSREMHIFLEGIVDEAKNLGIQTMTPSQIAEMESLWGT